MTQPASWPIPTLDPTRVSTRSTAAARLRNLLAPAASALVLLASTGGPAAAVDGPQFESIPVHPIELSRDGTRLFALHQADHRLLVFDLASGTPVRTMEIFVGLEPVTVRERTETEVWVVNHLSDSISIVDLTTGQVVRTLLTGDEPTDVVFAGEPERAFVCVSQEDRLRVFDPANLDAPPHEVNLAMSDPIALGVSPDGLTVYVAAKDSGNRTTIVSYDDVLDGGGPPPPDPPMLPELPEPPSVSLIVRHDETAWRDEIGRSWNDYVPYTLLDYDVLAIDTRDFTSPEVFSGVGTTLLGLVVSPGDGRIYVSNQEAFNEVRFEPNVSGLFVQNQVTVIDPGTGVVTPRHLNEHIDYSDPAGSPGERAASLSIPTALAVSADGSEVYAAAFGSAQVAVLDGSGSLLRRIAVGDGPCGLALDEARDRLYVVRRIPGALDVVDLGTDAVTTLSLGYDPTPAEVHAGRKRFYDGEDSSAHGDLSCASCHVFGGTDHIAWDLGNPQGEFETGPSGAEFHPMKGPLMTQSLQGLTETEPFHWRGDRPDLASFNGAFVSLLGRETELSNVEFDEMADFVFTLAYPPNPNQNLDGSLPDPFGAPSARQGEILFTSGGLFNGIECTGCHTLPTGENGVIMMKELIDGQQDLDVPQLRNIYEKRGFDPEAATNVRGFGFTHDGTFGSLVEFLTAPRFTFQGGYDREHVVEYLFHFDTGVHAAVGAQWTMDGTNEAEGLPRVETLTSVASLGSIGLIAKGTDAAGDARGWLYEGGAWRPDRAEETPISLPELLALAAPDRELTFTAVYPGTELRLGIDRDLDGALDRDELDAGTDPGDPKDSYAPSGAPDLAGAARLHLEPIWPNPASVRARVAYQLPGPGPVTVDVHDVSGRRVRSLVDGTAIAGRSQAVWDLRSEDGHAVPSGLYFVRVRSGAEERTQRVVVRR